MFKQFLVVCVFVSALSAAPLKYPTEEECKAELKANGMTQASIDGLTAFTNRFTAGYPAVKGNKEATDEFIAQFTTDVTNFVSAMPQEDQTVYNNFLNKYGLA